MITLACVTVVCVLFYFCVIRICITFDEHNKTALDRAVAKYRVPVPVTPPSPSHKLIRLGKVQHYFSIKTTHYFMGDTLLEMPELTIVDKFELGDGKSIKRGTIHLINVREYLDALTSVYVDTDTRNSYTAIMQKRDGIPSYPYRIEELT